MYLGSSACHYSSMTATLPPDSGCSSWRTRVTLRTPFLKTPIAQGGDNKKRKRHVKLPAARRQRKHCGSDVVSRYQWESASSDWPRYWEPTPPTESAGFSTTQSPPPDREGTMLIWGYRPLQVKYRWSALGCNEKRTTTWDSQSST